MKISIPRPFSRKKNSKQGKAERRLRRQNLRFESLEDRRLLAGDTWDTVIDGSGYPEVASDSTGSAIVATALGDQFELTKFATDGQMLWNIDLPIIELNGEQYGHVSALEIAPSGDILLAGRFEGSVDFDPSAGQTTLTAVGEDGFIASYRDNGASLSLNWAHLIGDRVTDIEVDSGTGIVAVGIFGASLDFDAAEVLTSNTGLSRGSFLANIAADGSLDMARQIEDAGVFYPVAVDINGSGDLFVGGSNDVDDLSGNNSPYSDVIVDGQLVSSSDNQDGFVMQFTNGGTEATLDWSYRFGESEFKERMIDMEVSSNGDIYLTSVAIGIGEFNFAGTTTTTSLWQNATALAEISIASGSPETTWVRIIEPDTTTEPAGDSAYPAALALREDASGVLDVFLTGRFTGTIDFDPGPNEFELKSRSALKGGTSTASTNLDGFLVALDSDGFLNRAWNVGHSPRDVSIAVDGTIHIVGRALEFSPPLVTASYDLAGLTVVGLNPQQPTVVFDPPEEIGFGEPFTIDANAYDLNNADISSSIVWSDSSGSILGNGSSVNLSGLPVGENTVIATVTDSAGRTGSFTFDVSVHSTPDPIAIPDNGTVVASIVIGAADAVVIEDVNVTLDITHPRAEDMDVFLIGPDGTRVELFTDVGRGSDFTGTTLDDESTRSVADYTSPLDADFRPEGSLSAFDGKNSEGTWSLELTDDRRRQTGTLNWWSLDISGSPAVPNDAPVITSNPTPSGTQDVAYTYDVNAADPNAGDVLTFSLDTAPSGMTIDSSTGVISWTPNSGQVGLKSVTVRVQDQLGGSDTQSFDIDVANVNDAPVAIDDSYDAEQDTTLNVNAAGILANDNDADGDTLSVIQFTQPANGTVVGNADGSFSYSPNSGFVGSDSFTYQVSDGVADGNFATVDLEVAAASTDEALYVYDIRFESKRGNKDWRAVFEIRSDSNANGVGDDNDNAVAGVAIKVTFDEITYSGVTDSNGLFRTSWLRNVSSGNYYANVDSLMASGFAWNPVSDLNREDDSDGDGLPDSLLSI